MPSPLRAADVLDGLAALTSAAHLRTARAMAATAVALRAPRAAVGVAQRRRTAVEPARSAPAGWIVDDHLTPAAVTEVAGQLAPEASGFDAGPLESLTPAERSVADKVAEGLTSRQIAADLFLSPRTVDAHLSRIYRKLDINTRARLASLVADQG